MHFFKGSLLESVVQLPIGDYPISSQSLANEPHNAEQHRIVEGD